MRGLKGGLCSLPTGGTSGAAPLVWDPRGAGALVGARQQDLRDQLTAFEESTAAELAVTVPNSRRWEQLQRNLTAARLARTLLNRGHTDETKRLLATFTPYADSSIDTLRT